MFLLIPKLLRYLAITWTTFQPSAKEVPQYFEPLQTGFYIERQLEIYFCASKSFAKKLHLYACPLVLKIIEPYPLPRCLSQRLQGFFLS